MLNDQHIAEPSEDERARYFRSQFYVPDGQIYMDGNSLGLLCRPAEDALNRVVADWRTLGVQGWTEANPQWFGLAEQLGALQAELIGASASEVIVTNSTTINLIQAVGTLFDPSLDCNKILCDAGAFPSDLMAIKSVLRSKGLSPEEHLKLVSPDSNGYLDEEKIINAITDDIALVLLPSVVYTTGQLLDMGKLSAAARAKGAVIGLDLSHSIGALQHSLDAWGVDFAVWCGYKYLNGGPGAAGGIYINQKHFEAIPALTGWFGADKSRQFDFSDDIPLASNAGRFQVGTPNILSMAPLVGSLSLVSEAGIPWIRSRSLALTDYLIALFELQLEPLGFELVTPREPDYRGGHVSLKHPEAMRICQVLRTKGIIPDYRPNNIVRLAPVALYNSFEDCTITVKTLAQIVRDREFETVPVSRGVVT